MAQLVEILNQRFGKLVVIERAGTHKSGLAQWLCQCDCGGKRIAVGRVLRRGGVGSCGCAKRGSNNHKYRHGYSCKGQGGNGKVHPLYQIWASMLQRCNNPNNPAYHNYGGRGIKVCERWYDFNNFLADVGERPHPDRSLDRYPNNDGHYEPGNVRWATAEQQRNNQGLKRLDQFTTVELKAELLRRGEFGLV